MNIQNKIALITGGGRGLGREMAISLAKKGIDVVITYNQNLAAAKSTAAEVEKTGRKAAVLQLDVADALGYTTFFSGKLLPLLKESFNTIKLDFLINNAGIGLYAPFTEATDIAKIDELINVNFKAGFFLTQQALGYLNDGGGIIHISTGLTRFVNPGHAAYASIKGALEVLTRYQAKELSGRKIRVNIVAPGAIETDFGGGVVRDSKDLNDHISSVTALGRVGLPGDIGPVVAFLCTEDAYWINAQRIEVSGGQQI